MLMSSSLTCQPSHFCHVICLLVCLLIDNGHVSMLSSESCIAVQVLLCYVAWPVMLEMRWESEVKLLSCDQSVIMTIHCCHMISHLLHC